MEEKRQLFEPLSISSLSLDNIYDSDPAEKNKNGSSGSSAMRNVLLLPVSPSTRELVGSTLFWIGFGVFGWYFPRAVLERGDAAVLSREPPYQEGGGGAVILDFELNQPLVDPPTVDNLLLRGTSMALPLILCVAHAWYSNTGAEAGSPSRKITTPVLLKLYRVATVISAFSAAIGLSEGSTVMVKQWVRRRRPNFYALCGFDVSQRKCTAPVHHIVEAQLSFPSGHSSLICCGMTFLVWYLHATKPRSSTRVFSLVGGTCIPVGWALFVAASRLVDHWHHPSDVVGGLALGFAASTIAYHHWYPPVWSPNAGIPLGLLKAAAAAPPPPRANNGNGNDYGGARSSIATATTTTATATTATSALKQRSNGDSLTINTAATGLDP